MSRELVLVAGASSDIGVALIRRVLTTTDARVVAHHHAGADRLEALRSLDAADSLHLVAADFSSAESVDGMARDVLDRFGVPTQVVYLPGLKLRYERFAKFDLEHFDRDLAVQVRSAIVLLKPLLPKMAKLPRAKVVFVLSSVTRGVPPKFMSMYGIVKHAQLGLMRSLASEYASTALTVNAVSPSMVDTRFLDEIPGVAKEMSAASAPRGRLATPDEVVGAIEFLLSEKSDFVTGVELPVSGGLGF
ncbi:MAG: short-chain dehydrogenase/reductase [Labilithrix sp.]|nr:short-chain dehydrogenase/reductase [Labilithrix sp.]